MNNKLTIGFIIDDPGRLDFNKDTSIALMQAANRRHWPTYYTTDKHIYTQDDLVRASWMQLDHSTQNDMPLTECDVIMMRLEPPVNTNYLYICQLLNLLPKKPLVVNNPQALGDFNEKIHIYHFPQFIVPSCISNQADRHMKFLKKHKHIVIKPLDGFGGQNIHTLTANDDQADILFQNMTQQNTQFIVSQQFIDEISAGDKRLFIIGGEVSKVSLTRLPSSEKELGNLAQGATPVLSTPTKREMEMAQTIAPWLQKQGILFAGLDVIGGYLTEINITCPTLIQEVKYLGGPDLSEKILDTLESTV